MPIIAVCIAIVLTLLMQLFLVMDYSITAYDVRYCSISGSYVVYEYRCYKRFFRPKWCLQTRYRYVPSNVYDGTDSKSGDWQVQIVDYPSYITAILAILAKNMQITSNTTVYDILIDGTKEQRQDLFNCLNLLKTPINMPKCVAVYEDYMLAGDCGVHDNDNILRIVSNRNGVTKSKARRIIELLSSDLGQQNIRYENTDIQSNQEY